jgi:hypothetical protein
MRQGIYMNVDTSRFDAAMKAYLLSTERDLHKAVNSRMFYLMVRLFVLVPPKSPNAERMRIGDYLKKPLGDINRKSKKTGKRIGLSRLLRRVHLIAQAKEKAAGRRGLYGQAMKVKAIRLYNRGFTQYKKPKWVPLVKPPGYKEPKATNAALLAMANQYGLPEENVAVHKGTRARGTQAAPGWNPEASVFMSVGIADNQHSRVQSIYDAAMQRALDDETTEMTNHMTAAVLANGKVLVDNGIDIK